MATITPKLIKACLRKDRKAQSKLYEHCFGFLMPVCKRYAACEDDAMEYLNLGFYKLLKNLDKLTDLQAFPAWARQIVIRTILDELRKKKRQADRVSFGEEAMAKAPVSDQAVEGGLHVEAIYAAIRRLPPTTAHVFNLQAIDGYKQREIAEMLGISIGTVKWHYAEARKRLQHILIQQNHAEKLAS